MALLVHLWEHQEDNCRSFSFGSLGDDDAGKVPCNHDHGSDEDCCLLAVRCGNKYIEPSVISVCKSKTVDKLQYIGSSEYFSLFFLVCPLAEYTNAVFSFL